MRRERLLVKLLGLTSMSALLLGCGGGDDSEDTATSATSSMSTTTSTTGAPPTSANVPLAWYKLREGQCIATLPNSGTFTSVTTTECTDPHEGEVVFSGQAGNQTDEAKCSASFTEYSGMPLDGSGFDVTWFSLAPDETPKSGGVPALPPSGAAGVDLMVICVAFSADGTSTGSLAA